MRQTARFASATNRGLGKPPMSDEFDPYFKWLGIAPKDQPPNYYRLLGIDLFVSDPDVISNSADRQMMLIRTFQTGKYAALSQRLLNEIAYARSVLLDHRQRAAYDAQLRAQIGMLQSAASGPPAVGSPPASARPGVPSAADFAPPTPVPMQAPPAPAAPPPVPTPRPTPLAGPADPLAPTPLSAATGDASLDFQNKPGSLRGRRRSPQGLLLWLASGAIAAIILLLAVLFWLPGNTEKKPEEGESPGAQSPPGVPTPNSNGESTKAITAIDWTTHGSRAWQFRPAAREIEAAKEISPGSWLLSEQEFADFILTVDYRLQSEAAGGIYVRVPADAMFPWNQGLEIHVKDDLGQSLDNESTGAIWHRSAPRLNGARAVGEWNELRVECRGRAVTVDVNGRRVNEYQVPAGRVPLRGRIGLDGVSGGIIYRNLRVEPLDRAAG